MITSDMVDKSGQVLGTFEQVSFPAFGGRKVIAKIDTGAYTGALHCQKITEKDGALYCTPLDGKRMVRFDDFTVRHVTSSNGVKQVRYFVQTMINLRGKDYPMLTSLSDRSQMRWPVLIGRRFLRKNNFLVDASKRKTQL